jgi:hypothetical protein
MHPDLEKSYVSNSTFERLGTDSQHSSKFQKSSKWMFSWENVSYSVDIKGGQKHILRNVTGGVEAGIFLVCDFDFRLPPRCDGSFWLW